MTIDLSVVTPWLAVALCAAALVGVIGAATARSLFGLGSFLFAAGVCVAAVLAVLGEADAALGQVLFAAGIAPVLLLACLLLTTRTAKPRRGRRPWLVIAAALLAGAATLLGTGELRYDTAIAADATATAWIAPLLFAAIAAAVALLGYSERGALARPAERDE